MSQSWSQGIMHQDNHSVETHWRGKRQVRDSTNQALVSDQSADHKCMSTKLEDWTEIGSTSVHMKLFSMIKPVKNWDRLQMRSESDLQTQRRMSEFVTSAQFIQPTQVPLIRIIAHGPCVVTHIHSSKPTQFAHSVSRQ